MRTCVIILPKYNKITIKYKIKIAVIGFSVILEI